MVRPSHRMRSESTHTSDGPILPYRNGWTPFCNKASDHFEIDILFQLVFSDDPTTRIDGNGVSDFSKGSCVPQRHDGIQAGGLERREIAEDHPHERREEKGYQDDPPVEDE